MAGSLNKVTLIGNVGRDPEIRFMPDGTKVSSFSVATSDVWRDKNTGERKDKTEWHKISIFSDRLADIIEKYVKKGTKVYIEGQLQTRKWTDSTGTERFTTEIVVGKYSGDLIVLDPKKTEGADSSSRSEEVPSDIPVDDEIPF